MNDLSKEEMWNKWQSDKKMLIAALKTLDHYGVKTTGDFFAVAELVDENNKEQARKEAIGFAEWCDNNWFRLGNTSIWTDMIGEEEATKYTTEQLYNLYIQSKQQ